MPITRGAINLFVWDGVRTLFRARSRMPTNTEKCLPCFAASIEGAAATADLSYDGGLFNNPTTTTTPLPMTVATAAAAGTGGMYIVAFAFACLPAAETLAGPNSLARLRC